MKNDRKKLRAENQGKDNEEKCKINKIKEDETRGPESGRGGEPPKTNYVNASIRKDFINFKKHLFKKNTVREHGNSR